jgi:DNA helicase-2/ATP-dependent DNA helicase PcrA
VLVRTHAQVGLITEALRAAAIPYRVRGAHALLERREVRAALDLLRRSPGPLAGSLPDLDALAADLAGAPDPAVRSDPDHAADDADADADDNLALVVQLAHDHLRLDPAATTGGFVSWLVAMLQSEGGDDRRDAVTVATFHAAKGLEWPVVHLAGLEDGLVPIAHARTRAERAEEARLLYVAMTRAEDELRCTWAARRTFAGAPAERRLTPWLQGLSEARRARRDEPAGPPPDWQARLAEQRARLAGASPVVPPTLAALHAWRDERARAARVEPAALVDDRLLEAIAERRPATHDELVAIPGMGRVLASRVGDGLLAALRSPVRDPR